MTERHRQDCPILTPRDQRVALLLWGALRRHPGCPVREDSTPEAGTRFLRDGPHTLSARPVWNPDTGRPSTMLVFASAIAMLAILPRGLEPLAGTPAVVSLPDPSSWRLASVPQKQWILGTGPVASSLGAYAITQTDPGEECIRWIAGRQAGTCPEPDLIGLPITRQGYMKQTEWNWAHWGFDGDVPRSRVCDAMQRRET